MQIVTHDTRRPFVGCFKVDNRCFVYDVNTNALLEVEPALFGSLVDALNQGAQSSVRDKGDLGILRTAGFCSSHRPAAVRSACVGCFTRDVKTKLPQVVLELTQQCNQRCIYCPYSDLDTTRRSHSTRRMDWPTAKAAIDLLLNCSSDIELPALGFYGGEPLLEWPLLKRAIEYARARSSYRSLHINLTTNGTCVTGDSARVLASNDVSILVSLDGPAEVHNRFRRMRHVRASAYSKTIDGLRVLRSAYGQDGVRRIRINAVCGPWSNYEALQTFFQDPPDELKGLSYRFSIVSHPRMDVLASIGNGRGGTPLLRQGIDTLQDLWCDALAEGSINLRTSHFLRALFEDEMLRVHKRSMKPLCDHVGWMGMCVPGLKKVYVDAEGRLLPCERISEVFSIGHVVRGGFDPAAWEKVLRPIIDFCGERCMDCIFCRLCSGCLVSFVDSNGQFSRQAIEKECTRQKTYCADKLIRYVRALTRNESCFDYLNEIVLT